MLASTNRMSTTMSKIDDMHNEDLTMRQLGCNAGLAFLHTVTEMLDVESDFTAEILALPYLR